MDDPDPPKNPDAKSDAWIVGFAEAERQFYDGACPPGATVHTFNNLFLEGTDQYDGFEEGVYTFTQK